MINLFQPSAGGAELAAIGEVFASSWLGTGPRAEEFERAFHAYIGSQEGEVAAVASCTEGLFQAVAALGLGPGDQVILPSISFVGAAHAVRSSGASAVLCDVDSATLNPRVSDVERVVTPATRAVLILHYGGDAGSVAGIAALAAERSLSLIEDAACGLGSFAAGRACGTFGDVGVWSFDSMKMLTTGDGGMVWCRDEATAEKIRRGVRQGVGSSGFDRRGVKARWWEIEPQGIGRHGTMNDVAAAIGLVQLERLTSFLDRRREVAAVYDAGLADLPWIRLPHWRDDQAARTFYWVQAPPGERDRLAAHLLERDVYVTFRYWPLHRTRMYAAKAEFRGAESAARSTLLLPLHQGLTDTDVERVLDAVRTFVPNRQ